MKNSTLSFNKPNIFLLAGFLFKAKIKFNTSNDLFKSNVKIYFSNSFLDFCFIHIGFCCWHFLIILMIVVAQVALFLQLALAITISDKLFYCFPLAQRQIFSLLLTSI